LYTTVFIDNKFQLKIENSLCNIVEISKFCTNVVFWTKQQEQVEVI
jgi:hypothetical protein